MITLLLKAGMAAPSAVNSQPWEFVVVTEEPTLEQAAGSHGIWQDESRPWRSPRWAAPKVAAQVSRPVRPTGCRIASAAVENILLAAANLESGRWCGWGSTRDAQEDGG